MLDVGSGAGGVDIALVRDHGAGSVVGIDVQQELIVLATGRAAAAGLGDRIGYRLIEPGPLPFRDASFDVVFSKDAIIHVQDKEALYAEAFRVRASGRPSLRQRLAPRSRRGVDTSGRCVRGGGGPRVRDGFTPGVAVIVAAVGFRDVETEDRRAWYLGEATTELQHLQGVMREEFVERWGEDAARNEIEFWGVLVTSLTTGALSPGHVRGLKTVFAEHSDLTSRSLIWSAACQRGRGCWPRCFGGVRFGGGSAAAVVDVCVATHLRGLVPHDLFAR